MAARRASADALHSKGKFSNGTFAPPGGGTDGAADGWQVWGCYRDVRLEGHRLPMRSRLEIFRGPIAPRDAIEGEPDLLAVMMNPGGSRPLSTPDAKGWCVAMPDRTQHQLMRLAERLDAHGLRWRHIRVVNLSDLRTPRSAELMTWLDRLSTDRHSLFCPARATERREALGPAHVPALAAWGLAPALEPWSRRALRALEGRQVLGLTDDGIRYRHPLPQRFDLQQAWLAAMERQVVASSATAGSARVAAG